MVLHVRYDPLGCHIGLHRLLESGRSSLQRPVPMVNPRGDSRSPAIYRRFHHLGMHDRSRLRWQTDAVGSSEGAYYRMRCRHPRSELHNAEKLPNVACRSTYLRNGCWSAKCGQPEVCRGICPIGALRYLYHNFRICLEHRSSTLHADRVYLASRFRSRRPCYELKLAFYLRPAHLDLYADRHFARFLATIR